MFWHKNQKNRYGRIADEYLLQVPQIYSGVRIEKHIVMPNHIHAIIAIENGPSLTQIIGQYKIAVTKQIYKTQPEIKIWQRSFHDHIIRNQADFERIWLYIHGNPQKWSEDCFFVAEEI